MPSCIFCLTHGAKLTREHVFPAALGGTLEVPDASCQNCNNGFSKIEQYIADRLSHFRRIFGIPDRYGKMPTVAVKVVADGKELDARLLPDGTVRLKPVTTVVRDGKGAVKEVIREHSTKHQQEQLRRQAETPGWEFIEDVTPAREAEGSFSGNLDFLESPEALRIATKIAYVALAYKAGTAFVTSDAFLKARTFIRTGAGEKIARLFSNERFLTNSPQGPHQHSVILVGQNARHTVQAAVRLFGGLCYFVTLSDNYEGADFSNTLALDAYRGEINKVFVTALNTEFLQVEDIATSEDTIWENHEACGRSFVDSIEKAISRIRDKNDE